MDAPLLYEDADLIAVAKPAGALVIPGRTADGPVALRQQLEADAAALGAPDLPVEVDLAQDLLRLFELGAPQGTLYGP